MSLAVRTRLAWVGVVASLAAACSGEKPPSSPAAVTTVTPSIDAATAGRVTGTITLQGTPPAEKTINTSSDPNCTAPVKTQHFVVGAGGALENVFVYVKTGLEHYRFPVPTQPVVLEQQGCTYRPHVLGVQAGQPLELRNEDPTLHNIHAVPDLNQEFNMGQKIQGMRQQHTFTTPEVLIAFKCDVHNWMAASVGVVEHPFFAVTGANGTFELKGLPPGTYTLEAVHEKAGRQTLSVTIGKTETTTVAFTFKI